MYLSDKLLDTLSNITIPKFIETHFAENTKYKKNTFIIIIYI